ncbi:MAG: hypothetical protein IKD66_06610 [Solobacterium sp.]|nr:hypothetical protein [Solobacterium sp.]MBR3243191.1 hypothetical protein [Parasporobacterium sp.]
MSERPKYQAKIENRISAYPYGMAFSASDFLDIADSNSVSQALFRIEKAGHIRRVIPGVYDKPVFSEVIQEYGVPRIDRVAEALARRFNWNIAPSGDTALNILHISTQVPNEWEYVSDGPYRDYMVGNVPLKFRHIMPREINGYSKITVMVIQGIRAIGKGNMTQELSDRFSSVIAKDEKKILLAEARTASGWIYKEIKRICEE